MPIDITDGSENFDASPVRRHSFTGDQDDAPTDGIGLCLSGGGYRAMVFHVGALLRLYECGILTEVKRFSSVSGGSITAGAVALNWRELVDGNDLDPAEKRAAFDGAVTRPIRYMAGRSIDTSSIAAGIAWFGTISDRIRKAYEKHIFGDATLLSLPESPSFIFNATNVQTGSLWRFSRAYVGDWRVGLIRDEEHLGTISLAHAVTASSAFPPVLSPARMELEHEMFDESTAPSQGSLQRKPYTTDVVLSDGGVYDNLGLESVFKNFTTVLVSDGGGQLESEVEPGEDWATHSYRVLNLIDNQVRSLRKRQLIDAYQSATSDPHHRAGTYFGIRTDIAKYECPDPLPAPLDVTLDLARVPTRLKHMPDATQERLINWGYAVADAAVRRYCPQLLADDVPKQAWPYPGEALG